MLLLVEHMKRNRSPHALHATFGYASTRPSRHAAVRTRLGPRYKANLVNRTGTMVSTSTACMGLAAAMGVGTLYVLLHEKKRKRKKLEQHAKDQPISKEMLLKILHKARRLR